MKSVFGFFLLIIGLGGLILYMPKHGMDWLGFLSPKSWTLLLYKLDDPSGIPYQRIHGYNDLKSCQEKGAQLIISSEKYRYSCGYGCPKDVDSASGQCSKYYYSEYPGCIDCSKLIEK